MDIACFLCDRRGLPVVQGDRLARDPRLRHGPPDRAGRTAATTRTSGVASLSAWALSGSPCCGTGSATSATSGQTTCVSFASSSASSDARSAQLARRLRRPGSFIRRPRRTGHKRRPGGEGESSASASTAPELPWPADLVMAAKILRVDPVPDADRLVLATVDYGADSTRQVVTGAPNLFPYLGKDLGSDPANADLWGALLLAGASYRNPYRDLKITRLKPKKLRGITSDAMLCSAVELGLGEDHEGIILFEPAAELPELRPGRPLTEVLGDVVLDIDVIPNIARCASILGVAREVAALTEAAFRPPAAPLTTDGPPIAGRVEIATENPELNPRFVALLIEGIEQGPSPYWMQHRLQLAGQRPISNVVDISNYVMLEIGQPNHTFDYDLLRQRADGYARRRSGADRHPAGARRRTPDHAGRRGAETASEPDHGHRSGGRAQRRRRDGRPGQRDRRGDSQRPPRGGGLGARKHPAYPAAARRPHRGRLPLQPRRPIPSQALLGRPASRGTAAPSRRRHDRRRASSTTTRNRPRPSRSTSTSATCAALAASTSTRKKRPVCCGGWASKPSRRAIPASWASPFPITASTSRAPMTWSRRSAASTATTTSPPPCSATCCLPSAATASTRSRTGSRTPSPTSVSRRS